MPPAITTRSAPTGAGTRHPMPNGPRTPTTAPGWVANSAWVTAPTALSVWVSAPSRHPALMEIGTSPTPKAYTTVTGPAAYGPIRAPTGASSRVTVSASSTVRSSTRYGKGVMAVLVIAVLVIAVLVMAVLMSAGPAAARRGRAGVPGS